MNSKIKTGYKKRKKEDFSDYKKNLDEARTEVGLIDMRIDYVTDSILLKQLIYSRKSAEMKCHYWYKLAVSEQSKDIQSEQ